MKIEIGDLVLIMAVTSVHPIDGAAAYVPPAKTGNMKDPEKIRMKEEEHEQKFLTSLSSVDEPHPLLSEPEDVEWLVAEYGSDKSRYTSLSQGTVNKFMDDVVGLKFQAIFGPHPTTHMRVIQNTILCGVREDWYQAFGSLLGPATVPRVNIWHDVCPAAQGDWREICRILGWNDTESPVLLTHKLAYALGYIV